MCTSTFPLPGVSVPTSPTTAMRTESSATMARCAEERRAGRAATGGAAAIVKLPCQQTLKVPVAVERSQQQDTLNPAMDGPDTLDTVEGLRSFRVGDRGGLGSVRKSTRGCEWGSGFSARQLPMAACASVAARVPLLLGAGGAAAGRGGRRAAGAPAKVRANGGQAELRFAAGFASRVGPGQDLGRRRQGLRGASRRRPAEGSDGRGSERSQEATGAWRVGSPPLKDRDGPSGCCSASGDSRTEGEWVSKGTLETPAQVAALVFSVVVHTAVFASSSRAAAAATAASAPSGATALSSAPSAGDTTIKPPANGGAGSRAAVPKVSAGGGDNPAGGEGKAGKKSEGAGRKGKRAARFPDF